jgi:hypothetical protein
MPVIYESHKRLVCGLTSARSFARETDKHVLLHAAAAAATGPMLNRD